MIDKEGKFYKHDKVCKKVNFKVNYVDFYRLLHAISINWERPLKLIRSNKLENISTPFIDKLKTLTKVSKYFYSIVIEKLQVENSAALSWQNKLNTGIPHDDNFWNTIYKNFNPSNSKLYLKCLESVNTHD